MILNELISRKTRKRRENKKSNFNLKPNKLFAFFACFAAKRKCSKPGYVDAVPINIKILLYYSQFIIHYSLFIIN